MRVTVEALLGSRGLSGVAVIVFTLVDLGLWHLCATLGAPMCHALQLRIATLIGEIVFSDLL
jgi:hypothetical protein